MPQIRWFRSLEDRPAAARGVRNRSEVAPDLASPCSWGRAACRRLPARLLQSFRRVIPGLYVPREPRPSRCGGRPDKHKASRSILAVLLYNNAVSGSCYKVRLLAAQLGIKLELRELDVLDRSNRKDVLGGLNPALGGTDARLRRWSFAGRVERHPLVPRRRHRVRPDRLLRAGAGPSMAILRAVFA